MGAGGLVMRNTVLVTLALIAAYTLGTLHHAARADEQTREILAREHVAAEKAQAEALTRIARTLEDAARAQRDEVDALRNVARSVERVAR